MHQCVIPGRQPHLTNPDAEARANRRQLRQITVGPECQAGAREPGELLQHLADKGALLIETNQRMARQCINRVRYPMCRQVTLVRMQSHFDAAQPLGDQRILDRLEHAHGNVRLPLQQVISPVGHDQFDAQSRMPMLEFGKDRGQHFHADDFTGGQPDRAAHFPSVAAGDPAQCGGSRRDTGRIRPQFQRRIRRRKAIKGAHEQLQPQRRLQLFDVTAHRRLREPHLAPGR